MNLQTPHILRFFKVFGKIIWICFSGPSRTSLRVTSGLFRSVLPVESSLLGSLPLRVPPAHMLGCSALRRRHRQAASALRPRLPSLPLLLPGRPPAPPSPSEPSPAGLASCRVEPVGESPLPLSLTTLALSTLSVSPLVAAAGGGRATHRLARLVARRANTRGHRSPLYTHARVCVL